MGIEPTLSAWKAEVLPLNYTRKRHPFARSLVEGEGFEPSKAEPADLQSAPFDHSGTPPKQKNKIQNQKTRNKYLLKSLIQRKARILPHLNAEVNNKNNGVKFRPRTR
jgi:hypothetical protein